MKPLTGEDNPDIEWLLKDDKHGLWDYQAASIIRTLIDKINELNNEVEQLKSNL